MVAIDWLLIVALALLCTIGLSMIYSTTGGFSSLYVVQLYSVAFGVIAFLICISIDYRKLTENSHLIYLGVLALLVYVLLFGVVRGGSQRWIDLGIVNLQPSEFAKAATALVLAKLFGRFQQNYVTRTDLFIGTVLALIPILLIATQPDLGTAVALLPILFAVVFISGISMRVVGVLAMLTLLAVPITWQFVLQDYQRQRIETFLDPEQDPRGAVYQQIQARITVGSGGPLCKGFRQGTQGQLRLLPVAHNDFIFSVLAEEMGFVGFILLLSIYTLIIYRCFNLSLRCEDNFSRLLGASLTFVLFTYVFVNMAMVSGLLPVVGVPLPLISYGGSSLMTLMASFGIIMSLHKHKSPRYLQ